MESKFSLSLLTLAVGLATSDLLAQSNEVKGGWIASTVYSLAPSAGPTGIVTGRDGALRFTEETGNKIGRITVGGAVTEFAIPTAGSEPFSIVLGSDGALWFTERGANQIGRITTSAR